ncbi:MAG: non-homologous end-joining DNA ligase [Parachlamydiaceae bacterium]
MIEMPPMLATLTKKRFSNPDWIFELKYDGERALAVCMNGQIRLLSRNNQEIGKSYPELVSSLLKQKSKNFVIDGEIIANNGLSGSFAQLQHRLHVINPTQELLAETPVCYIIFDILSFENRNLESFPLVERKKILKSSLSFENPLVLCESRKEHGELFFKEACQNGWEGIIAKRSLSTYQHKRSLDWLKFKCSASQEFVIGGFTAPQRSRFYFGALLIGYYDDKQRFRYAGKVGTGFTHQILFKLHSEMEKLISHQCPFINFQGSILGVTWLFPCLVGEFKFTEWTEKGRLRHPSFVGLRRDKKAEEVVREQ